MIFWLISSNKSDKRKQDINASFNFILIQSDFLLHIFSPSKHFSKDKKNKKYTTMKMKNELNLIIFEKTTNILLN